MTDIDDLDDCPEPWRSEIERLREENERLHEVQQGLIGHNDGLWLAYERLRADVKFVREQIDEYVASRFDPGAKLRREGD